jgi:hypothetical protein
MTDAPPPPPKPDRLKQAGLVAAVLLLPGGFILGATLIARKRAKKRP